MMKNDNYHAYNVNSKMLYYTLSGCNLVSLGKKRDLMRNHLYQLHRYIVGI